MANSAPDSSPKMPNYGSIEKKIYKLEGEIKTDKSLATFLVIVGVAIPVFMLTMYYLLGIPLGNWMVMLMWFTFFVSAFLLFGAKVNISDNTNEVAFLKSKLEGNWEAEDERDIEEATDLPAYTPTTDNHLDLLIQKNIANLQKHHQLVKKHAERSFQFCIASGGIGFLLIMGGVGSVIAGVHPQTANVILAAGVVVELVAGLAYFLYHRTLRHLKDYHDDLAEIQDMLFSFKMVKEKKNTPETEELRSELIDYLVHKWKYGKKW